MKRGVYVHVSFTSEATVWLLGADTPGAVLRLLLHSEYTLFISTYTCIFCWCFEFVDNIRVQLQAHIS